jgi:outer membrane immunogenic protein
MKKFLLAATAITSISGSAFAADLAVRPAPVYRPAPVGLGLFSWTGCFVGGNGGGIWAKSEWNDPLFGTFGNSTASGGLGGLQVGCNYQAGNWVFGVQGDYDWASATTDSTNVILTNTFGPTFTDHTEVKSIASVTGRVGYAWDRFLLYAKGGGAWLRTDHTLRVNGVDVATTSDNNSRGGWTAGVGGEYAFTNWLTGFVEWDYYKFDNNNNSTALVCTAPACGGAVFVANPNFKETVNVVKVGLNLKWGPGFAFGGW